MELSCFIEESILSICIGIRSAQEKMHEECNNYPIAPGRVEGRDAYNNINQYIDFELSVSASESKEQGGKLGCAISVLSAHVNGKNKTEKETINKIKFSVPFYPQALNKK
ncbi:MAG: hypothetical protein AB7U85_05590 [Alphaproteobacteria bacterium]